MDPNKAITQYIHESWGIDQGLEQKDIYAIIQTKDQYLWLGTSEGLLRFDGHGFCLFNKVNIENLKQSFISTFLASRDGTLWIGTYGGGLLRLHDGRFSMITSVDGLASNLIRSLCEDRNGGIWIGSFNGIDHLFKGNLIHYSSNDGLCSNNVKALCQDSNGVLWAGTANGLNRLQGNRFIAVPIRDTFGREMPRFVNDIREARDGGLWICLHGGGLVRLKDGVLTNYSSRDGLSNDFVLCTLEDREGNLWVGTMGGGLNRFYKGRFSVYSTREGLVNDSVFALYEDRDGSVWVGTIGNGGLNRFRDGKFLNYSLPEGLNDMQVWSIFQSRDDSFWIGSQHGLNQWKNGVIFNKNIEGRFSNQIVRAICEGRDGSIWIGTEGNGLIRMNNGRAEALTTKTGLSHDIVWSVWEDRSGCLWVGTDDGLTCYRHGLISRYSTRDGLPSAVIRAIYESSDGSIWLGTNGGLVKFRQGVFTTFTTKAGLSLDMVRSIQEDREGDLWIGTLGGGLNRLKDGHFTVYTSKEGLAADEIWSIHEDDFGYLWMSCNRGIFRVQLKQLTDFAGKKIQKIHCDLYGKSEGLLKGCLGGSTPAGSKARDGRIWFSSQNGIVVVDPSRIPINREIPPVLIEQAVINNVKYENREEITVAPGRGNLEFQYTALSFLDPEKVKFKYRLEGFEQEWNNAENRRVAYYTNIPPGIYTFRVTACNSEGLWNKSGASLSLDLKPFFYQTVWFFSFVGLAVFGLAVSIFRFRVRRLKARAHELTLLVDQRTEQLQHAMEELTAANIELERLTLTDRLTDVANRRGFEKALNNEWRRCMREKKKLSLIIIDIDFFKNYNDTFGHLKGDECLQRVAFTLKSFARRPGDMVARYGGEEFVVLLPATESGGASSLAEQMRSSVEKLAIAHPTSANTHVLTISLGIATIIPDSETPQNLLLAYADQMLYQAKKEGRNRLIVTDM